MLGGFEDSTVVLAVDAIVDGAEYDRKRWKQEGDR
jgi:hypothetical protein